MPQAEVMEKIIAAIPGRQRAFEFYSVILRPDSG